MAIIEIHDVSPKFQKELEIIFDKFKDYDKIIAVVPNWEGRWDIREYPDFIKLVKKQKGKIYQHGCTHSAKLPFYMGLLGWNYIGWEFKGLNKKEIQERIKQGEKIIKEAFGKKPEGFIYPCWIPEGKRDLMFSYSSNPIIAKLYRLYFPFALRKIKKCKEISIHPNDFKNIDKIIGYIM